MNSRILLCLFLLAGPLGGCAGLDVAPVKDENSANGYRYYQQAPFLFVRSDGKGGVTSEIVFLPDTTHEMSANPFAYLATNNATLTFNNGALTEASVVGDETVVPVALADALTKAAGAAIAADNPSGPNASVPVPYLFKIIVHAGTIELNGGPAVATDGKTKATISVVIAVPAGK
jgi:hypothetical protein